MQLNRIDTDILVLGGGLAAAQAALESRKFGVKVLVVDKGRFGFSGATTTSGANPQAWFPADQGGDPHDSREILFQDTIRGGVEIADSRAAETLAEDIYARIVEALNIGVPFRKNKEGRFFS